MLSGAVWLAALSLSQLSSRTVAMPAIEQGVSALTEIDTLLAIHEEELCNLAEADAAIEVPGFPVQGVDVRIDDIRCVDGVLDRDSLRTLLLTRSAEQVYLHGADAFSDGSTDAGDASILSPSGGIQATLDSVGASMHDRMEIVVLVLGVTNAVLLGIVLLLGRGIRRFAGAGLVLILAALPLLIGGLILWFGLGAMTSGNGLTAEFATITRSLLELPLRNALVVAGAGVALLVPVLIVDRLVKRAQYQAWWEHSPDVTHR